MFCRGYILVAVLGGLGLGIITRWAQAEDARVLPKGRSRFGIIFAQTSGITSTFDATGRAELITAPYNVDLSAQNLRSFSPDLQELVDDLNLFNKLHYNYDQRGNGRYGITNNQTDPNLGDALSRGFLNVSAEGKHTEWQFAYQYGVTDRLSIGVSLPYAHNSVHVDDSLTGANTADDIYHSLLSQNPGFSPDVYQKLIGGLNTLRSANTNTLQNLLVSKGYLPFVDYDGSGFGDMVGGARYNYFNQHRASGDWLASAQAGFTAPTGSLKPPGALTQIDFGQGVWDVGFAHITNYSPTRWLMLSNGIHYTHRLPGSRDLYVRKDPTDLIPDASDNENVQMRLGDKYWTNLGADVKLTDAITLFSSYEWYWKTKDEYSGPDPSRDYTYLSDDTFTYLETWQVGLAASSIPAFLRHELPVPADLSVAIYVPRAGRNTTITPYGVAQLGLYF